MPYQTKEDILAKWETTETRAEAREIKAIKQDILKAVELIRDAKARYIKQKLKLRSKAQATESPYKELENYSSEYDIQEAFGWGFITEAKMDMLIALWRSREKAKESDGKYHDRVTDMLDVAMRRVGDEFREQISAYDEKTRAKEKEAAEIALDNNRRSFEREHGITPRISEEESK